MPKRVLDFDAMWASDKIAACAEWAQAEYAWCYGLADANGSFELTNLRVSWSKVSAIRRNLTIERFEQCIDEFHDKGLLFIWAQDGKRYGHWTGSDKPGRLPRESRRTPRYGPILAPAIPKEQLRAYVTHCVSQCDTRAVALRQKSVDGLGLGLGLGVGKGECASHTSPSATSVCEQIVAAWNANRGSLPEVLKLTKGRKDRVLARIKTDPKFPEAFERAVIKARTTPFCSGSGERGWKANFDWFIANDTNYVAVLEGKYDDGKGSVNRADERTRSNLAAAGLLAN
jgi:hypothetical protein